MSVVFSMISYRPICNPCFNFITSRKESMVRILNLGVKVKTGLYRSGSGVKRPKGTHN